MARSVRSPLETRSQRLRLSANGAVNWHTLESGLSVGFCRPKGGAAGTWRARVLVSPPRQKPVRYRQTKLGLADDHQDADGARILSWSQAQAAAQAWGKQQTGNEPLTVAKACERYVAYLKARKSASAVREVEGRIKKHIDATLGKKLLSKLTTDQLQSWHEGLVRGEEETEERRRKSRDTANRMLTILKAALNLAFNGGLVATDRPWRRLKPLEV